MPLMAALDPNNDGVIDEKEIEQASKALKTLDKNSDGKITMEELRPPRPEGSTERRPEGARRPERPPQNN
jgi:Ca2+-binding EF-hand superfamily protein